ncbi:MAG: Hpt domain-containing protein [Candidatus Omnitrophica bacterium]|nr:Hpt domain-containing protein [Candidatus Omnitrophota bacterium]
MNEANSNEPININIEEVSQSLRIRPEVYTRIVSSFAKTLQERLQGLNDALAAKDSTRMRRILHEIKGTSGNLRLENIVKANAVFHEAVKAEQEPHEKLVEYYEVLKIESDKLFDYTKQFTE